MRQPLPSREAGLGTSSPGSGFCRLAPGGGAALPASFAETCGFIPRTHHAAFTQCPDLGNWAGRCLVMLAGPRVNARIQLISFRQSKRPLPCFYPIGLWPQSLLDRHVSVCPGAIKCAEIFKYSNSSPQMPGTLNIYWQQFARVRLINGHQDGAGACGRGKEGRPGALVREFP